MGFLLGKIFRFLLVLYVAAFCFFLVRPFPETLKYEPVSVNVAPADIQFLADVTYTASSAAERVEESIFPKMLEMVEKADQFVYADMFLFNQFQGSLPQTFRNQTKELADAFVAKKQKSGSSSVIFMTDPINRAYGGMVNEDLDRMEDAGVHVHETPLDSLRDSNPLWSTIYRTVFFWTGNSTERGWLPNPLDAKVEKVTLRTYARLLNFKANHRKVLVTDERKGKTQSLHTLVGSMNPHTASSKNGNVALLVKSTPLGQAVITSENALLALGEYPLVDTGIASATPIADSTVSATYMTESTIEQTIVETINRLNTDDRLDIAIFYLSDRDIIRAIERAINRGVTTRILLDANDSAFGKHKYGIPNRQTAERLLSSKNSNLTIKWCNTHGEQCHAKMLIATQEGNTRLLVGSANYTRRNLNRYNLESAILIETTAPIQAIVSANQYFNRVWNNTKGETSVGAEVYRDRASWKRLIAWIMETAGLSTF